MTEPGSRSDSESTPAATGVAAGGLGTGANLEDTQVFRMEDLAAPEAEAPETSAPVAARAAAPIAPAPAGPAHETPAAVAPAPVAPPVVVSRVRPTVARRVEGSNRPRGRGLAGVLAAALVVLAGVAFVVSRDAGTPAAGQTVPSADGPATAQPDGNGPAGGGDGADEGDPGKGSGKDKPCRGNGNGRGCDDD